MKRELNQNLGDEVDYTNSLILLVKNMLCSKLHDQKGLNSISFSYQFEAAMAQGLGFRDWGVGFQAAFGAALPSAVSGPWVRG